jgi:hypothetical protein
MSKNANIESMMETVENIFNAAQATIESLDAGERMQIKALAQTVGLAVAMEPKHHFVHHTDIAYVTRGKNGGVVRGTRPAKTDKAPKKAKKAAAATDSSV